MLPYLQALNPQYYNIVDGYSVGSISQSVLLSYSHMRYGMSNSLSGSLPLLMGGKYASYYIMGSGELGPPSVSNCISIDFLFQSQKFTCNSDRFKEKLHFYEKDLSMSGGVYIELQYDVMIRLFKNPDDFEDVVNVPDKNCECDLEEKRIVAENFWMRVNLDNTRLSNRNNEREYGIKLPKIKTYILDTDKNGKMTNKNLKNVKNVKNTPEIERPEYHISDYLKIEENKLPMDELMEIRDIPSKYIYMQEEEKLSAFIFYFPKKFRIDMSKVYRYVDKFYNYDTDTCGWEQTEVYFYIKNLYYNDKLRPQVMKLLKTNGEEYKFKSEYEISRLDDKEKYKYHVIQEKIDNYLFQIITYFEKYDKCIYIMNTRTLWLFQQKK